jgi:hypothetical protein
MAIDVPVSGTETTLPTGASVAVENSLMLSDPEDPVQLK